MKQNFNLRISDKALFITLDNYKKNLENTKKKFFDV